VRTLRIAGNVVGLVLTVIGLASIPDDLGTWADWLDPLKGDTGRWLFVVAGIVVILAANVVLPRVRRSPTPITTFAPTSGILVEQPTDPVFLARQEERTALAGRRQAVIDQLTRSAERKEAAERFREAFDSYMDTFLARRHEWNVVSAERRDEMRAEYRELQPAVVRRYRGVRDRYRAFLADEPAYDLRPELYEDDAYELALDYPLTYWWKPLTFDEAVHNWANADVAHIRGFLERQRAVLDAFADWTVEAP